MSDINTYSVKADALIASIKADRFDLLDSGHLVFYIGESPIFEQVAIFAPGQWSGVIREDHAIGDLTVMRRVSDE